MYSSCTMFTVFILFVKFFLGVVLKTGVQWKKLLAIFYQLILLSSKTLQNIFQTYELPLCTAEK